MNTLNVSNNIGKIRKIKVNKIYCKQLCAFRDSYQKLLFNNRYSSHYLLLRENSTRILKYFRDLSYFRSRKVLIHNTSCTRKSLKLTYAWSKTNRLGVNLFNKSQNAITNKQPFSFMKAIRPADPLCTHGTTFQPFNTLENTLFHLQEISSSRPRLLTETLLQYCPAKSRSQLKLLVLVYISGQSS